MSSEAQRIEAALGKFTAAMRERLQDKVAEGVRGWDDPEWVQNGQAQARLEKNAAGKQQVDMVDAGILAMMVWWHGGGKDSLLSD